MIQSPQSIASNAIPTTAPQAGSSVASAQFQHPGFENTADSVHFGQKGEKKKTAPLAAMLASLALLGVSAPAANAEAQTLRPAVATAADIADAQANIVPVHDRYWGNPRWNGHHHGPRFYPRHNHVDRDVLRFLYLMDELANAGRYDYPRNLCNGPRWNGCTYVPNRHYHTDPYTLGSAQTDIGLVRLYRNGEVISRNEGYVGHITANGNAYVNNTFKGYGVRERITVDGEPMTVAAIYNKYDRPVGFVAENGEVFRLSRRDDGFFKVGFLRLPQAIDYPLAGAYALLAYQGALLD